MRLRERSYATAILGSVLLSLASSFDIRHRREVPDSPENYQYYVRPFVMPEMQRGFQPEPIPKSQSLSESPSSKQYKPPLLAMPAPILPASNYQPPLPLLQPAPRPAETAPTLERKPLIFAADDNTELSQSPPERRRDSIDNRSKAVGSHHPSQAIHQVPASEIQSDKGALAKDRDSAKNNDEYVVYYYYYYDNDTNANNLTLNFDDIPSLDSYDDAKTVKEPERSASSRSLAANVNALTPSPHDQPKDSAVAPKASGVSQPRSVSSGNPAAAQPVIKADKPDNSLGDTTVQPLKPVSNIFRYGSNDVPRFPVLPNFIVSEVPKEKKPEEQSTPDALSTPASTTLPTPTVAVLSDRLQPEVDSDDANNVLDSDTKTAEEHEEKIAAESSITTTTTTTTEPPTTTEIQTTTTEKSRRRPGLPGGGRRRFSGSSAAPTRGRQPPTRSTTSSSSAISSFSTSTASPSTRSSFRSPTSNRLRPRQPIAGNRPRPSFSSTRTEDNEDSSSTNSKVAETSSTTASRSRFSSTAAPRRFAGSRSSVSRPIPSSTTASAASRLRTTSRPRPSLITRNRPRPGFLRPRPGKEEEPEPLETTTQEAEVTEEKDSNSPNPEEETQPEEGTGSESPDSETPEAEEEEENEEPTTTEKSRFAALFRPRNRNAGGNRPRPVIANRPSRSRR